MALRIVPVKSFVIGDRRETIADVTFDNRYRTGGMAITAAQLGLSEIDVLDATNATTGHVIAHDRSAGKLIAFLAGVQVTDDRDLSTVTTRVVAHGKGGGL